MTARRSEPAVSRGGVRGHDLERSLNLLSSVLESPDDLVIFSLDHEYRYTAFNSNHWRTMKTIWGVEIEVGLEMLSVIKDPADRQKARENFDRALAGERFTKVEAYGEAPNRFYYEDSYNPILDAEGTVQGLTVFLKDITERMEREEELAKYRSGLEELVAERTQDLERARDQLEREIEERERTEALLLRSQRLEALGTLAGGVAHDFNNLLTAIVGYSDLLLAELPSIEFAPDYLHKIKAAGRHGSNLTSRLLAFSRRQVLQSSLLDLNDVVEQMADLFDHVLPEHIQFSTELAAGLPRVRADRAQIEQVIMNLVVNSRDAMPQGGQLMLSTAVDRDDWIRLVVEDKGSGMTAATLERIFDPFFTTKEGASGSGLGLSMVYGIVEQHGGSLDVTSQPDEGTRVVIKLPVVESDPAPESEFSEAPRATNQPVEGNARTLLLVEDDASIRTMARLFLEREGYQVLESANAQQALKHFERAPVGSIDLLFSDVVLPDRDGVSLARELVQRQADLRILLTSGYSETRVDTEELLALPAYRFLSKPYYPKAVLEMIDELLAPGATETSP